MIRIFTDASNHYKINYSMGVARVQHSQQYYSSGLVGNRYIGYFNDDNDWFLTATPHGDSNVLTQIDNFSSSLDYSQEENYSWEWNGYFKPSSSELYTFYTTSDDASYLWLNNTLVVNNGGSHGAVEAFGEINLIAGIYYPIKIQFGENTGLDVLTVSFSSYTIPKTTDGGGYYYHN